LLRFAANAKLLLLKLFELHHHGADVMPQIGFGQTGLFGGFFEKDAAGASMIQIELIDMEATTAIIEHRDVESQHAERPVSLESPHPPAAVFERDRRFGVGGLNRGIDFGLWQRSGDWFLLLCLDLRRADLGALGELGG